MTELLAPLIGLATLAFQRSNHKKKMEYTKRLAELEIEYNTERQKPLSQQNDGKIERLMIEISAIAKVAEHEARIVNNQSIGS